MSFPGFPEDMESGFANYLGKDPSTFPSNENPAASAPVDFLEEALHGSSERFTWNEFLEAEGIERYASPEIDWEWDANEGNFIGDGIGPPLTVDEPSSEEPAQPSGQEEGAHTIVESENTNEQPVVTAFQPKSQPKENVNIPDDDSLFGDSISDDIEVPKINEKRQLEVVAQGDNGTPELVADTPQHSDSATSAPITPDTDSNDINADNVNDSLFGDIDDSDLGEGIQIPREKSSKVYDNLQAAVTARTVNSTLLDIQSDDVDDLFGNVFGADFEAELDAEIKKDSTNAVAPAIEKHTGLYLSKPPRKVSKRRVLHLPDPPRAIANPQGLHLPDPPLSVNSSQGLQRPDPPRVTASSQELNIPVPPLRVPTNHQEINLSDSPPAIVAQQSGADTSAQKQTDDQEDPASIRHRRVRTSRIPRSDMSRPKGRGRAGKALTQLSGPAPSKLPEAAPSSSSGAADTAEKPTRLPRWAFGKYGNFGKPVAGSKYRKAKNSASNPITVEDQPKTVEKASDANSENQNVAQPAPEISGAIDLTSTPEDHIVAESTIQGNQDLNHNNGKVSAQSYENFQTSPYGDDQEFGRTEGYFSNAPKLSFAPIVDDASTAPHLQTHQSNLALAPYNAPNAAPPYQPLQRPTMEGNSMNGLSVAGGIPFVDTNNQYRAQAPDIHVKSQTSLVPNHVHQSPYTMEQTGAYHAAFIPQPIQNDNYAYGNYEEGNLHGQGCGMGRAMPANEGDSTSSGLIDNRPKKRPSHERAEFGDPRVLLTYGEFKQIFPLEPTRGCFEVAIQNELAADAAIIARGGIPPQRPTIRKAIICTWSQAQHLNRIRAATGEKLFHLKPNAHKRPAAFQQSMQRKRKERGETSESEESDAEPETKRSRLDQGPIQLAPAPREQYKERTSQIHSIQSGNRQRSTDVSHPPSNHGIPQGPCFQNMGQAPPMQIHQPLAQFLKRKIAPEQLESFESIEQEMRPQAKRPRIAPQMGDNIEPKNNQSLAKEFQDYVSQRQSEYLKLRVPELRQVCSTRKVQHDRFNQLMKGGLVGVLVGHDVSRHPVYSQMHNQARNGVRHPVSNVGAMGGMNPPLVPMNRDQQQLRATDGWAMRQDSSRPDFGPVHGMGGSCYQQAQLQFPPTAGRNKHSPIAIGNGKNAQPSRNVDRAQQPLMNANVPGLTNNSDQPLANARQPPRIGQPDYSSMANQSGQNLYPQSRLPVSTHKNGYNNSGVQRNLNGGRDNYTSANAQVPAHGIYGGFGNGVYRPAVDDRRRKPRIEGQNAPSSIPQGAQSSLPQPTMNNATGEYAGSQQPIADSGNGNLHGSHHGNTLGGSQIPRPVPSGNMGADSRSCMQNHPQSGLHPAPMQGLPQGAHQQHAAAPVFPPL